MLTLLEISFDENLIRIGSVVAIVVVGVIVTAVVVPVVQAFRADLKYINMEINRTEGREQAHWIKRRRQLWLSLIPFYRYH